MAAFAPKGTVFIVGGSRGIGLGLARIFSSNEWNVHVTIRDLSVVHSLPKNTSFHVLDVTNDDQIKSVARSLTDLPIDVLIFNAGVHPKTGDFPEEFVMKVNAESPFNFIDALFPSVLLSSQKKMVILSSQLGSREKFGGGKTPTDVYGKSKCLLNDRFRAEEVEWRKSGISAIVIHPGWVQTDMGGLSAPISVEESVEGMFRVVCDLTLDASGKFLTYQGLEHPW